MIKKIRQRLAVFVAMSTDLYWNLTNFLEVHKLSNHLFFGATSSQIIQKIDKIQNEILQNAENLKDIANVTRARFELDLGQMKLDSSDKTPS